MLLNVFLVSLGSDLFFLLCLGFFGSELFLVESHLKNLGLGSFF